MNPQLPKGATLVNTPQNNLSTGSQSQSTLSNFISGLSTFGQRVGQNTANEQVAGAQQVGSEFNKGVSDYSNTLETGGAPNSGATAGGGDPMNLANSITGIIGGAARSVFAPVTGLIQTIIQSARDNKTVQKLAQTPAVSNWLDSVHATQQIIDPTVQKIAQSNPELARTLSNNFQAGLLAIGGSVLPEDASWQGFVDSLKSSGSDITGVLKSSAPDVVAASDAAPLSKAEAAVQGAKTINTQVGTNLSTAGKQFASDATDLAKSNPDLKLNLTPEQVDSLNALRNTKTFTLPDSVRNAYDSTTAFGKAQGNIYTPSGTSASTPLADLNKFIENPVSLDPVQTQDLLRELNRATYKQGADGLMVRDYSKVPLTNEIKASASQTFGKSWDDIYTKYSGVRSATDKIDNIVNLDPNANPADIEKQIKSITDLNKTSTGKVLLKQAVDEYKASTGIDLSNPVQAVQKITGNWAEQVGKAVVSPQAVGRKLLYIGALMAGVSAVSAYSLPKIIGAISKQMKQ